MFYRKKSKKESAPKRWNGDYRVVKYERRNGEFFFAAQICLLDAYSFSSRRDSFWRTFETAETEKEAEDICEAKFQQEIVSSDVVQE